MELKEILESLQENINSLLDYINSFNDWTRIEDELPPVGVDVILMFESEDCVIGSLYQDGDEYGWTYTCGDNLYSELDGCPAYWKRFTI